MPEGHKTHRLAIDHQEVLGGKAITVSSPQGRFRSDARKVSGEVLNRVQAVGKHLFYSFQNERIVHIHLGRYGRFKRHDTPPPKPVGQIRMRMVSKSTVLDLSGPTTCSVIDPDALDAIVARLGPDPLSQSASAKSEVWKKISVRKKPIAALLLDQTLVAGIGNIFRAEMLFEAQLDPTTPGDQLSTEQWNQLWRIILKQMRAGLKYGKIVTVSAREAGRKLSDLEGKDRFRIYGRTDCPRCGSPIETTEIANRRLYYCGNCQRPPAAASR